MKSIKTCILVADGAHARVYLNEGPGKGLEELEKFNQTNNVRESGEIASDAPGRSFDSGGQGRHAMEPPTDPKEHEKNEFHREIAEKIDHAFKIQKFDRLVVVAPPQTLGNLRSEFDKTAAVKIYAEINKNLISASDEELLDNLGDVLAV